jgi:hypothetical protein
MLDFSIAQAIVEGDSLRAQSSNFAEAWRDAVIGLCRGFGRPIGEAVCPEALFAKPIGKERVAIVQVAGPPERIEPRFRLILISAKLYFHLNDPFAIANRFPPDWEARGSLPDLAWPPEPLPPRTVAQLDDVLKHGDGPFLLGASQALVDSGKIVLQRPAPDPKLLGDLWSLLPHSTRRTIWPATFAFSNDLGFDVVALPNVPSGGVPGYLNEDQARDYPDSGYERQLQIAIEARDQAMLDRLLSRRSSAEALRLALSIVLLAIGALAIFKALTVLKVI